MKILKTLIASSLLSLTIFTTTFASGPRIIVNNKELPVQAVNQGQGVLVPLRAILESLNTPVDYDNSAKTITANQNGKIIVLKIGDKTASVNGAQITLDVPTAIIASTTLVPVRFIAESLGARVNWENNTVIIDTSDASTQEDGDEYDLPEIKLAEGNMQLYMTEDVYLVEEKLVALKGSVAASSKITKLKYKIDYGAWTIAENDLPPSKNFTLENLSLVEGNNVLTIEATDSNNRTGTLQILIIAISDDNSQGIIVDQGDDDEDGLLNYEELYYGTDPKNPDTDGDGLTDYEEIVITRTDPLRADSHEDFDQDGLTNLEEMRLNGDPHNEDTDWDGLTDGEEALLGTRLDKYDTDDDGLSDFQEITLGTDPLNPDTSGNGILDGGEFYTIEKTADVGLIAYGTLPTLTIDLPGKWMGMVDVDPLYTNNIYLPSEMPGYIGPGYEISGGGDIKNGTLSFAIDPAILAVKGFKPAIYYFDRDQQVLTILENQVIDLKAHTISARIDHSGIYIVLNNTVFLKVWDMDMTQGDLTIDSDGDGLADFYEKNLRYFNGIRIDTDPNNPDIDGDGLLDGEEVLVNIEEITVGGKKGIRAWATMISHPKMVDTDGDGFSDYVEVKGMMD